MIRLVSAAAALTLLAAPAFAADVTVHLAGKSAPAAYASIVRAAKTACHVPGADIYSIHANDTCVQDTVAATVGKLANPQLNSYIAARKEFLEMAKL